MHIAEHQFVVWNGAPLKCALGPILGGHQLIFLSISEKSAAPFNKRPLFLSLQEGFCRDPVVYKNNQGINNPGAKYFLGFNQKLEVLIMLRTVLFSPANDERKAGKAMLSGADAVTLDLEDAVAYSRKEAARESLRSILSQPPPVKLFIRVNSAASKYILADLEAVVGLPVNGLMLAKAESAVEVLKVDWLLGLIEEKKGLPAGKTNLIPFIESAGGIIRACEIAACTPRIKALAFGGVDFSQELGLRYPSESDGIFFARSQLVLASKNAGIDPPLDTVFPDIKNTARLESDACFARKLGFQGKLVIHPAQVEPVNRAFTPTPEEIEYARKVVAAFGKAEGSGTAVLQVDGKMVEYPIYRRSRSLLSKYGAGGYGPEE